ncbi:MAG TPA: LysR substrate-binding domain-containing protein, partial [Pseudolabrys sp.]|nr:LysR substrate-binding domain-containing protein [Pseudolabrys sp.]
ADALAITQPALSKTLRELEDALGVKLFERGRRGMVLTRFGEIFLQHAAGSIASLRHGVDSIDVARSAGEHAVAIGALPNVAAGLVAQAVRLFKKNGVGTSVRVVSGGNSRLLDQLRLGELELVVGRLAKSEHMTGLTFDHLYSEPLSIVVRRGHVLATAKRFSLPMLSGHPWLLPDEGTIIRQEIDRFLLAEHVSASADVIETTSTAFGHAYVAASDAVWFVPRGVAGAEIKRGTLVVLPTPAGAMEGPVGITTRNDVPPTPAGRLLADAVRRTAQAMAVPAR